MNYIGRKARRSPELLLQLVEIFINLPGNRRFLSHGCDGASESERLSRRFRRKPTMHTTVEFIVRQDCH